MLQHPSQSFVLEKNCSQKVPNSDKAGLATITMYVLDYIQVHRTRIFFSEITGHCHAPNIPGNTWVLFENYFEIL